LNKLAIPAILVATVMVAGMFAFIPVEQASTVHATILLDLEEKIKLSEDSDGPTIAVGFSGTSTITIRALDDNLQPTVFNLKECYLEGTTNGAGGDNILVSLITVDGDTLSTATNGVFIGFGPRTAGAGTSMVEVISGLGFTTGLGATDTITMSVIISANDLVDDISCIAFVQNNADLVVSITEPTD